MTYAPTIMGTRQVRAWTRLVIATALLLLTLFPVLWLAQMSLRGGNDVLNVTRFHPTFANYTALWTGPFPASFLHSLAASLGSTAFSLLFGVPAAYVLARWRFRGAGSVAMWILVTRMAPPIAFTIPFFLAYSWAGLMDTVVGLGLIYVTFNLALVIWTMKGFFDAVPRSLEEAAWIDGCGVWSAFRTVAMPLAAPGPGGDRHPVLHPVVERLLLRADPDAHQFHDRARGDRELHAVCRVGVGEDRRGRRAGDAAGADLHLPGAGVLGARADGGRSEGMILVTNNEGTVGAPTTARMLADGAHALDAIEAGIRLVEADPSVRTVGRGGWPNLLGEVELDSCVMDGTTLRSGAVGALKGFLHPVSVAREMMHRLPHELLVGDGAARFAREIGAETTENLTEDSRRAWQEWFENEVPEASRKDWARAPLAELCRHAIDPETGRDTTVFLAHDMHGDIGSGTSTSGWAWKYPGRLGDSPIVGAGSYADTRYGAAACTGAGEMTIRCCTARSVVLYMKAGASVRDAVMEAVEDMRRLKGGLISRVTIHAIDARGNHKVVAVNGAGENRYWLWAEGDTAPRSLLAEPVVITSSAPRQTSTTRYTRR